jgi:hypothetical protein
MNRTKRAKRRLSFDGTEYTNSDVLLAAVPVKKIADRLVHHDCQQVDAQFRFLSAQKSLIENAFPLPFESKEALSAVTEMDYDNWMKVRRKLFFAPPPKSFHVKVNGVIGLDGAYRDASLVPWMFGPKVVTQCAETCTHEKAMTKVNKGPPFCDQCVTVTAGEKRINSMEETFESVLKEAFSEYLDQSDTSDDYCFRLKEKWQPFFEKLSPDIVDVEDSLCFDEEEPYSRHHFAHEWRFYLVSIHELKQELVACEKLM